MYKKHFFLLLSMDAKKITYKYYTNERTGGKEAKKTKKKKGENGICIYVYAVRKQKREKEKITNHFLHSFL